MILESRLEEKIKLYAQLEKMGQELLAQSNSFPTEHRDAFEPFYMMLEGIDRTDSITEHDTLEDLMAGERTWWVGL